MKNTDFMVDCFSGKYYILNKKTGKILIPHSFQNYDSAKRILNFDEIKTLDQIKSFNCFPLMEKIVKIQGYNTFIQNDIKVLVIK